SELEQFLAPYSPMVQALALKLRALVREVIPDAIEQLDVPAHLIGYGLDRSYKGLICGITLHKPHIKIQQAADLESPAIETLLRAALRQHQETVLSSRR